MILMGISRAIFICLIIFLIIGVITKHNKFIDIIFDSPGYITAIIVIISITGAIWMYTGVLWSVSLESLEYNTKEEFLQVKQDECNKNGTIFHEDNFKFLNDKDQENHDKGNIIGNIIYIIAGLSYIMYILIDKHNKRYEKQLEVIKDAMIKCRMSNNKTLQELYYVLAETKEKIRFQMNFAEIEKGINMAKRIQKQNKNIDIQEEIDKLNAFQKLNKSDINTLINKYKNE